MQGNRQRSHVTLPSTTLGEGYPSPRTVESPLLDGSELRLTHVGRGVMNGTAAEVAARKCTTYDTNEAFLQRFC